MEVVLIELFSGTGGFAKGLHDAGFVFSRHYFSEVDKHAIANYKYNFKDAEYIGSVKHVRNIIRTVDSRRTEETRLLLTFGSPCQDFSLAGKGDGLKGAKSSLIKYAIFLIKWLRPDIYIWENVKGTYSANDGADYWAIMQAFANIHGYRCEQQLLNTSWFLPQNRERIYTIGHLTGRSEPGVFPVRENDSRTTQRTAETAIVNCLTAGGNSGGMHSSMTLIAGKGSSQSSRVYKTEGISPTLYSGNNSGGHSPKVQIHYRDWRQSQDKRVHLTHGLSPALGSSSGANKPKIEVHNLQPRSGDPKKGGTGPLSRNDGNTYCLDTGNAQAVNVGNTVRRLTEIECERLQGFPDNWTQYGIYERIVWINKKERTFEIIEGVQKITKTQRYKLCGNAVSVLVVKAIGGRLKKLLSEGV